MVLFSTKFPVSSDFTQSVFLSILRKYVLKSLDFHICPVFDDKSTAEYVFENTDEKLLAYRTMSYVAAQLSRVDGDKLYVTTYVLNQAHDVPMFFIHSEKMSKVMTGGLLSQREIPVLLQEIFWQEYGGMDHGLLVDDKPLFLRKTDTDLMQKMFVKNNLFLIPVLYVGLNQKTGQPLFDINYLASVLAGVVHVVVPKSLHAMRVMESVMKTMVDDDCLDEFDVNIVTLLLPNGNVQTFDVNVFSQEDVVSIVSDMVINVAVDDAFSFSKLRLNYLLSTSADDSDLGAICDELLREKDDVISVLQENLSVAEQQIYNLKSKSDALSYSLVHNKDEYVANLALEVTEVPFYEHEIEDIVFRILRKEYDAMTGDKNLVKSRKYHVLKNIVEHNTLTGISDEIRAVFDEYMKDGRLNRDGIAAVERLDFEVSKTGGGHYRIMYHGDNRYQIAMSSSPSDVRAGDNLVATYMNSLFGY